MKELIKQIAIAYLEFLLPIKDYILISEVLICSNFIFFEYVRKNTNRKHKYPLWLLIFAAFIAIITTRLFDIHILDKELFCKNVSQAICYYQLYLITKNVGLILGFDLSKYINLTNKTKSKNEND